MGQQLHRLQQSEVLPAAAHLCVPVNLLLLDINGLPRVQEHHLALRVFLSLPL